MKQRSRLFSNWILTAFAVIGLFAFTACEHDLGETDSMMYTINGNANGSQVSPTVTGTGTGTITGTYDQNTNQLTYTITWTGLSGQATAGYLFTGTPGPRATTAHALSTGTLTSTASGYSGKIILTREEEIELLNGRLFYAISTGTNARGEIAGKITAVRK